MSSLDYTTTRTYDLAGHVLTQTYPSGHTVSYNYDAAGRLADNGSQLAFTGNIGDGVQRTYSTQVSYSPFGGMQQEQFGTQTALYHKLHYNVRGQLYDIRLSTNSFAANEFDWNRGCVALYYGGYAWGQSGPANNGNLSISQHFVPADDQISTYSFTQDDYTYDSLNRLSSVTERPGTPAGYSTTSFVQAYNYDQYGNRTINQSQTYGVPNTQFEQDAATPAYQEVAAPSNRLYAPGDGGRLPGQKMMDYDDAGNLVFDSYTGNGSRAYDAENRMTSAQDVYNGTSTYIYNADGQRIKRVNGYGETWQVYGIGGELLAEYQAGMAPFIVSKEYGYRGGELLVTMSSGDDQRLQRFVKNLYYNTLARDPSSAELQQQMNALGAAGVQGETQLLTTAKSIARGLFQSSEYVARGRTDTQYVTDLYNSYLQRGPDTSGLNYWVSNTQSNGRGATLNAFEVSTEFATLAETVYGTASGGDNERVDHFIQEFYYGAYQRAPTSAELQQQEQRLNNAAAVSQSQVVSEAQAMGSDIFQATNYNSGSSDQDYVTALYEAFLQRAPDGPGLNYWVSNTQSNGRAATLNGFKASTEYHALAGTLYRETFWLVSDHLGTPRMVADKSGKLTGIKRHDYLPFGGELYANTGGRTTTQGYSASDNVRQKFTGYERDGETNLDYAHARYYASAQGRFTGADPLLASGRAPAPQTWNRYSYALNNPLRIVDPTGMEGTDPTMPEPTLPPPPPQLTQLPMAPPPVDSSMEGSPEYVAETGVRQVVDVRHDPAIVNGIDNIHGTPLPNGTAPVLTNVVPIVGTSAFVYDSAIVDAYGNAAYGYTGTVRPVAYVPVDQGGKPMGQTNELVVREAVHTVSGEGATTSGAAPQNASGIFIDIHTTEPGSRPTVLNQQVVVDQFPGGPRMGANPASRVVVGTVKDPTVINKDSRGTIDVKIGATVVRHYQQ